MAESKDLRSLVNPGDVLAAAKTLIGGDATVFDYEVKKGTESVQGLMSMILRVVAKCRDGRGNERECRFIVKRLPALEAQVVVANEMQLFNVEVEFFNKCVPLLRRNCPDLNLVRCLFAHEDILVFEDLGEQGFSTLAPNILDLTELEVTLPQVRLVLRTLAKFHAASLIDVDWVKLAPQCFEKDVIFEINDGKAYRMMAESSLYNNVAPIMRSLYPEEKIEPYLKWLCGPQMWEKSVSYVKPSKKYVNVIGHGDFWMNNMMFRLGADGKEALEVRIIDMQTVRFGSPFTDLQYFLYLCTRSTFRRQHEEVLLRTYLEAFNAAANRTPDPITWAEFSQGWEETRLFGVLSGLSMIPILFTEEVAPAEGEDLTTEQFENLMSGGGNTWDAVAAFNSNQIFRDEIKPLIEEFIEVMDKNKYHLEE